MSKKKGFYVTPSLEIEGFIHCSKAKHVNGVLRRYYRKKKDLLKLAIDLHISSKSWL